MDKHKAMYAQMIEIAIRFAKALLHEYRYIQEELGNQIYLHRYGLKMVHVV